jgi:FlaA1/EpsC-like NDP-sugar epimerase
MKVSANLRVWLAFVHDVCAAAVAWSGLYWLRFNLDLHEPQVTDMWRTLAWILPLQAAIFLAFGLYRGLWRFASLPDLQRIVLAAGLGAVAIPVVLVMLQLTAVVPRSVLILYPLVLVVLMAGSRFAYRIWKEHRLYSPLAALGEPELRRAGEGGMREHVLPGAHSRRWRVVGCSTTIR